MKKFFALMLIVSIALCVSGCAQKKEITPAAPEATQNAVDYTQLEEQLASVREQAAIQTSLEQDALTQLDMNDKSAQLRDLWEGAMNTVLQTLQTGMSEDEFQALSQEQNKWVEEKEKAVEEAGKEVEGGSLYALTVNQKAAEMLQARTEALYEMLKNRK